MNNDVVLIVCIFVASASHFFLLINILSSVYEMTKQIDRIEAALFTEDEEEKGEANK